MWVNGEKYVFSEHVVESGTELHEHFTKMQKFINSFFTENFQYGLSKERDQFSAELEELKKIVRAFDELWTIYESKYVYELMVIEQDARRFVIESINIEAALMMLAKKGKTSGQEQFDKERESMLSLICQINAVANEEGKGRDDFEWALMQTAEQILSV